MDRVYIQTKFWKDEKVKACPWPEKLVLLYLLTNEHLKNIGFLRVNMIKMRKELNSDAAHSRSWSHRRPITKGEIRLALGTLRRRKIILMETSDSPGVFIAKYLWYAKWSPSVVKGWPRMIDELGIGMDMEDAIRKVCLDFCERRGFEKPAGLAKRS